MPLVEARSRTEVPSSAAIPVRVSPGRTIRVGPTTPVGPTGGIPVACGVSRRGGRRVSAVSGRSPGAITSPASHGVIYPVDADPRKAEILGSSPGEVEFPPPGVRTTVVDYDLHKAATITDRQLRPERQRSVGRRETVGVEDLATGRTRSLEATSIMGGQSCIGRGTAVIESHESNDAKQYP